MKFIKYNCETNKLTFSPQIQGENEYFEIIEDEDDYDW